MLIYWQSEQTFLSWSCFCQAFCHRNRIHYLQGSELYQRWLNEWLKVIQADFLILQYWSRWWRTSYLEISSVMNDSGQRPRLCLHGPRLLFILLVAISSTVVELVTMAMERKGMKDTWSGLWEGEMGGLSCASDQHGYSVLNSCSLWCQLTLAATIYSDFEHHPFPVRC